MFITDPAGGTVTIDNMRCRKLGDIKNGEEQTFSIGDEKARVL